MNSIELTCAFCAAIFDRSLVEHNRRVKKLGEDYTVRCKNCKGAKHGYHKSSEYSSWNAMKNRCDNISFKHYDRYGGRGISYDPRWKNFSIFLEEMGTKPSLEYQLERIDNDKNYCKNNCIWVTRKEQTRNRGGERATRLYTYDGKTMCIKDWADYVGISPSAMQKRLNNGWPLEKAFSSEKHDKPDLYTYEGKTMSLKEWSEYLGVKKVTLDGRLRANYPLDRVFTSEKFNRWTAK